jgi:hypothetical protein
MTNEPDLEGRVGNGFSHVVFYKTNPNNPDAVKQIIENANRYLANIPGIRDFAVAPRYDSGRVVQGFDYNVALNFIFDSRAAMLTYMKHPDHMKFVEFVLNGWRLEDSDKLTVNERKEEFMDYVLNAKPKDKRNWAVDSEVPDSERVWAGEQVYDFG